MGSAEGCFRHQRGRSTPFGIFVKNLITRGKSKTAFLFPGQGSQTPDGKRVGCTKSKAREILEEIDNTLGFKLRIDGRGSQNGWLTQNAQPALFASLLPR